MLEQKLELLTAAIEANTKALNEILSAGSVTTTPEPAKPAAKGKAKAAPAPEPEPEPAAEEETPVERPTKVAVSAPKEDEFSDPLDSETTVVVKGTKPAIDTDAVIKDCVESFKAKMVEATDAERKSFLKDQFVVLRDKYGLEADAKLITLAPTPEKLVGLLADIKAL
jgi:hypothetical protein